MPYSISNPLTLLIHIFNRRLNLKNLSAIYTQKKRSAMTMQPWLSL